MRNLEDETDQKINDMPITYDITKDKLYLRGKKEEKEKAQKELETTQRGMIERMLATNQLTIDQVAEIADVPVDFVQSVQRSVEEK